MPQVTKEAIIQAKQMDLLTYLQTYEPHELCQRIKECLTNGMWCWWSRDIGGRSALDYLTLLFVFTGIHIKICNIII